MLAYYHRHCYQLSAHSEKVHYRLRSASVFSLACKGGLDQFADAVLRIDA